ncbi:SH3 domain-binding glutamic acid-rich-like protein 3 [Nematostella vectensis]|uniref:SH3 domain-binding glutamic acid-rich-like protein 3 n=1 Tax=Nematostella vectensis TaxID=45351 RepID=UPI0013905F01|nr:SH3 domain-binding glutamic acid-rich-like protein 3 [Nematostella vectensis]
MGDKVTVYYSSICSTLDIKKKQKRIEDILGTKYKQITIEYKDIANSDDLKAEMRDIAKNEHAIVPQIARGGVYLGDYDKFDAAVEGEFLEEFLKN